MNATPRLSGLQKRRCLPGPGRFSGREGFWRLPFVLAKQESSAPSCEQHHRHVGALLVLEKADVTQERRSSSRAAATCAISLTPGFSGLCMSWCL